MERITTVLEATAIAALGVGFALVTAWAVMGWRPLVAAGGALIVLGTYCCGVSWFLQWLGRPRKGGERRS